MLSRFSLRQFSSSPVRSPFRKPTLLALSGSTREESVNTALVTAASDLARSIGANVDLVDMREFPLPLFSDDAEKAGVPDAVLQLKAKFLAADGLLIASPEYNGSITPLLCNTLAWMSRSHSPDEGMYAAFKGKLALIMAASPGALGNLILSLACCVLYVSAMLILCSFQADCAP